MKHVIERHYNNLANKYDDYLLYSPDFVRHLTAKMVRHLDLDGKDVLADIGCGTAMYSRDIVRQVPLEQPILGVDPYQSMLDQIPDGAPVTPICQDALAFSRSDHRFDKALMKETVHHVEDRPEFFHNVHRQLSDRGRFLLVHVPPRLDYPLFQRALERCLKWHADPDDLEREMQGAGFTVKRDAVDWPHRVPRPKYFEMVRNCYMSVLTSFDPEEIEEGLREMESRYGDRELLEFNDHFDYVLGVKE